MHKGYLHFLRWPIEVCFRFALSIIAKTHIVYVSRSTIAKMLKYRFFKSFWRRNFVTDKLRTIFLDCDGTLWPDEGTGVFTRDFSTVNVNKSLFNEVTSGYQAIFLVTNQSFFARQRILRLKDVISFFRFYSHLGKVLGVNAVLVCLHHPLADNKSLMKSCSFRKPNSGLILLANHMIPLDFTRSAFVGDRLSDMIAGSISGIGNCLAIYSPDFFERNTEMRTFDIDSPLVFSLMQHQPDTK